jgi:ribosomal protein S1
MTNSDPTMLSQITTDTAKEKQQKINQAYQELKNAFDTQTPIEVEITDKTKGGFKSIYKDIPLYIPFNYYSSKRSELSDEEINSVIGSKIRVKVKVFTEDEFGRDIKVDHKEVVEDAK